MVTILSHALLLHDVIYYSHYTYSICEFYRLFLKIALLIKNEKCQTCCKIFFVGVINTLYAQKYNQL